MTADPAYPAPTLFIAGDWRAASDGGALPVVNPATGETIAQLVGLKESECSVKKGAVWWLRSRLRDGQWQTVIVTVQSPELL